MPSPRAIKDINKAARLLDQARFADASKVLAGVLKFEPKNINALNLLGQLHLKLGNLELTKQCYQESVNADPSDIVILYQLALIYEKLEEPSNALACHQMLLKLKPDFLESYQSLARILDADRQIINSLNCVKLGLSHYPDDPGLLSQYAVQLSLLGKVQESIDVYRKLCQIVPDKKETRSAILFGLHHLMNLELKELQVEAESYCIDFLESRPEYKNNLDLKAKFAKRHELKLKENKSKLRLGLVSADLNKHPVGYYLHNLLGLFNKDDFEIHLYYNNVNKKPSNYITEKLTESSESLIEVRNLSDIDLAKKIFKDEIDILFDLSGFTLGERMGLFKLKPAPIQVAWLGYPGTMGMPEMDYYIVDKYAIKDGEEEFFTERVYKMEGSCNHADLAGIPEASEAIPYDKNGYISFGVTNTIHKIIPETIKAWVEILKQVPNSKLIIDSRSMQADCTKNHYLKIFRDLGIDTNRITIISTEDRIEFIEKYNDYDINLDPFPYTGATTTIESLAMGVPTITIEGKLLTARLSSQILKTIDCDELVATNVEEYIKLNVELANNPGRLLEYKKTLRDKLAQNMDIRNNIASFEKAFKDMWFSKTQQ